VFTATSNANPIKSVCIVVSFRQVGGSPSQLPGYDIPTPSCGSQQGSRCVPKLAEDDGSVPGHEHTPLQVHAHGPGQDFAL
jgi:hypothetical protein